MITKLLAILSLLIFSSSAQGNNMVDSLYTDYEMLANKAAVEIASDLSAQYNIIFCGIGGSMNKDVKILALSFDCYRVLTLEEARSLLVNCSEKCLKEINSNNELRPHLSNYPFTANNLELTIYMHNPDGSDISMDRICTAGIINGSIDYKRWKTEFSMETILEESFEEAVRIVGGM